MEVNFSDKDTVEDHEKMLEFFKIPKDKQVVNDMNEKVFDFLYQRIKDRQIVFYAFLNKEFNILNYKSARCSMHCFDSDQRPLGEVGQCLKVCRQGITGCREFAFNQQKEAEDELDVCHEKAKDQTKLSDPVIHWIACYEKLIKKFDGLERNI